MSIKKAKEVLRIEAEAIYNLIDRIDQEFVKAVETIYACKGRVVVTGVGKSGIIGRKIAATLTSTGTPALFLHPVEGMHGDLGKVVKVMWSLLSPIAERQRRSTLSYPQ